MVSKVRQHLSTYIISEKAENPGLGKNFKTQFNCLTKTLKCPVLFH